jgi:hypothetical protein
MANKNYSNYSKPKKEKPAEPVIPETPEVVEEAGLSTAEVITEPVKEPETPKTVIGTVIKCEKLNVRSAPSLNAKINLTLAKGEGVVILELVERPDGEDFYKIGNPEHPEYVMAKYIKIKH